MITLLWTKSHLVGSKLIRWGLDEPTSHFAVELDNRIVFHSNFSGTNLRWSRQFYEDNEVVFSKQYDLPYEVEEGIYQNLIKLGEKPYDIGAFIFFFWRGLLWKMFDIKFPLRNKWASGNRFLCTEIAAALSPLVELPRDIDMLSPFQLYRHVCSYEKKMGLGNE